MSDVWGTLAYHVSRGAARGVCSAVKRFLEQRQSQAAASPADSVIPADQVEVVEDPRGGNPFMQRPGATGRKS